MPSNSCFKNDMTKLNNSTVISPPEFMNAFLQTSLLNGYFSDSNIWNNSVSWHEEPCTVTSWLLLQTPKPVL